MKNFWRSQRIFDQLRSRINRKSNSLDKSFPNYEVLKDAFENIVIFKKKSMKEIFGL